jgi:hypothetical protein
MPVCSGYVWRLIGGVKSCLILAGATDNVSSSGFKSCLLLVDRRWCDSGWNRGGIGRHQLPISAPAVSG